MTKPSLTRRAWTVALASLAAPRLPAQTPVSPATELDQARDRMRRAADQLRQTQALSTAAEPAYRFEA